MRSDGRIVRLLAAFVDDWHRVLGFGGLVLQMRTGTASAWQCSAVPEAGAVVRKTSDVAWAEEIDQHAYSSDAIQPQSIQRVYPSV